MKYTAYLLFFFTIIACQPINKSVTLNVELQNNTAETAKISGHGFEKELIITEGKIEDALEIPNSGIYTFQVGYNQIELLLTPGSTYSFSADTKEFSKSLTAEGELGEMFSYQDKKKALKKDLFPRSTYQLDANEYLEKVTELQDSVNTLLLASNLPQAYVTSENASNKYDEAGKFLAYKAYFAEEGEELPEIFEDAINQQDFHNEAEYLKNSAYRNLVSLRFSTNQRKDTVGSYEEIFMRAIDKLPAGNIKNNLLYNDMRYIMGPNEKLDDMYAFFKKHSTDEKQLAEMGEKYSELLKLAKGEVSPSFDYENYLGGNTKLEDLRGKYVYVDVWATWCGPCLGEIPSLKKVEEDYHNKNIEFVSISIDNVKDHEKWQNMIQEKTLGGTQLFADNAWESQFVQDYKINGIPRFILIDPEGKIVTADAPRPSDEKLINTFNDLSI